MLESKKSLYWAAQLSGWLVYACIIILYNFIGGSVSFQVIASALLIAAIGLGFTHIIRSITIKFNWLKKKLYVIIPTLLVTSFILGITFHYTYQISFTLASKLNFETILNQEFSFVFQMIMSWTFLLFFWSILYFAAHYFFIYRQQEIRNLKIEATRREIELANLKAQLNPHFMFNALNSIRALVEENPTTAKKSITQLSGLLRGALSTGKKSLIKFEEELELVKNYLALEKVRFEERLEISFDICPDCLRISFPPLLLQTLVENGIKHGISKLPKGGTLKVETKKENKMFVVQVSNSGRYAPKKANPKEGGIGLKNTARRLNLLYGKKATLTIKEVHDSVITTISIPVEL